MKKDPTLFRERFKRWKEGEQVYEAGLPKYEDGTFPDSFYKKLYDDKRDRNTPDVDYYQEAYDYSEKEALDYEKFLYSRYPDDYSVYGGLLPGVTVKPDPNSMSTVRLYTYYPVTSRFPFTGHSELSTEGGNVIDVRSDDPEYNLVFNNCSDATRRALQLASGKKLKYNLFTTPGDVRDFAESLGGKTHKHKNGYTTTTLQLPTKDVRNIAKYSKYLLEKRDDEYWKEYNKFWNAVSNARDLKRNNKYFKNMPINTKTISNAHKFIFRYEDGKLPRYEDGITPYQKYIDATEDQQNGRYLQQGPWNNPIVLFFDPTGVSGYPQVKEAFDNGNTYDKAVSILGAIPLLGKLKPAAKAGSVVNIPNDVKSYLDWDNYYRSIIYKDNKNGSIGPRKYIGSADYHEFKSLIRKGEIRKATPTEIQWWYDWTGGDSASPGLPLGSAILQPFENYKRLQKILLLKDKNFNGRWFKKHENGKLPKYADGLTPYNKRDVNTNQALYNSEEDLYSPRYTLPEVTVTGTNKRPHTHAPIHLSKNAYKMQTGDLLGAMTTGINVLSPSLWYGAVRDGDGIQDGFNKLMRGNSGFVTEDYAKDHPYMSLGANLIGDAAIGGIGTKTVLETLRIANNIKNRNLFAYTYIPPYGYMHPVEKAEEYVSHILKDRLLPDPDNLYTMYNLKLVPYAVKSDGGIFAKFRDAAWRKYLNLNENSPLYIDNGDGTFSYDLSYVLKTAGNSHSRYFGPENVNYIFKSDVIPDYVTGNGGNVSSKVIYKPDGSYNRIEDVWDLHPFKSDGYVHPLPDALWRKIGEVADNIYRKNYYNGLKYQNKYSYEFLGGKILNKVRYSDTPKWFMKPLQKLNNMEMGPLLGGKPFTMRTDVPLFQPILK